jgi:hypothetical protein
MYFNEIYGNFHENEKSLQQNNSWIPIRRPISLAQPYFNFKIYDIAINLFYFPKMFPKDFSVLYQIFLFIF